MTGYWHKLICGLMILVALNVGWSQEKRYQIVCRGAAAGGYAAFPDVCRAKTGDLLCVFYAGYGHVSTPNEKMPNGGRVMVVRSTDNGKTWSPPFVVADTVHDDRDPHIACLSDGTLICNWFVAANPSKPLPSKVTGKNSCSALKAWITAEGGK